MSDMITVARPYAKAAFEFAVEDGQLESWQEMLVFAAEVAKNQDMKAFLSGSASADKMAEVFIQVCGEQINEKAHNLIKVMAENGRLTTLPSVVDLFTEMAAEYRKEITVDVTSAAQLTEEQKMQLNAALDRRLKRRIKLNCSVDASLVGGLVVKAGDTIIDSTLRSKLNRLSDTLQS
ncbi:MAG: F-type H+-transporting ATPase subunit delta [Alteromonadaceae bacterium]|jgi:F-type H+-transporting ATPase subunit delta